MPARQSRRWAWTLLNPTEEEITIINALFAAGTVSYLIYGKEIAPSTGTAHLQGYLETPRKLSLGGVKRFLFPRVHLEIARGTSTENIRYCKKDRPQDQAPNEFVFEQGLPIRENQHGNAAYDVLNTQLRDGCSLKEIAETNPSLFCRMHRGIDRYFQVMNSEPRVTKSTVHVYWGSTGTGKSRRAHEIDGCTWTHMGDRWFDNCLGHAVVLFDDFEGIHSGITYKKLLNLTDRYRQDVPSKGGFNNWNPELIIFTTNEHPKNWYPGVKYEQLERRIDLLLEIEPETIRVLKGTAPDDLIHLGDDYYYNPFFE